MTAKDPFEQLLLHAAAMTKFAAAAGDVRQYNVLNHFDDGGWLAFAFYIDQARGEVD